MKNFIGRYLAQRDLLFLIKKCRYTYCTETEIIKIKYSYPFASSKSNIQFDFSKPKRRLDYHNFFFRIHDGSINVVIREDSTQPLQDDMISFRGYTWNSGSLFVSKVKGALLNNPLREIFLNREFYERVSYERERAAKLVERTRQENIATEKSSRVDTRHSSRVESSRSGSSEIYESNMSSGTSTSRYADN